MAKRYEVESIFRSSKSSFGGSLLNLRKPNTTEIVPTTFNFCSDAWVAIAAIDWTATVGFYQQLFGRPPHRLLPNSYAEFTLPGGLRLGIFCPREDQRAEFARSAGSGVSLYLEVTDLEAAIARLQALGYPPPGEILQASHGREVYAYDPAGNRPILHQS